MTYIQLLNELITSSDADETGQYSISYHARIKPVNNIYLFEIDNHCGIEKT